MMRTLQLGAPRTSSSTSFRELADYVRERKAARTWLDLVEREYGYLIASARAAAEARKEARHA
jgi:hypothetical protein